MKTNLLLDQKIQAVEINTLVISESSRELFNYEAKQEFVTELANQIHSNGIYSPLVVYKKDEQYVIVDGVLRFLALQSLNLNEVNCIIQENYPTSTDEMKDRVISFNLKSTPSVEEKKRMIIHYLRLENENKLDGKTFEERIQMITAQFGKGWGRNNVINFKKVLKWEQNNPENTFNLSSRIVAEELSSERAKNFVDILEKPDFNYDLQKEEESKILENYLNENINLKKTESLIRDYNRKKEVGVTQVNIPSKITSDRYQIILGNCLDIEFPENTKLDGIFTSVPYFQQIEYGKTGVEKGNEYEIGWEKTPQKYVENLVDVMKKGADNMKESGVIMININDSFQDGVCVGVVPLLIVEMQKAGFFYLGKTVWVKKDHKPQGNNIKRFANGYEDILVFSKTKNYYYQQLRIYDPNKKASLTRGCSEQGNKGKLKKEMSCHISNPYKQIRNLMNENDVEGILNVNISGDRSQKDGLKNEFFGSFPTLLPVPFILTCIPEEGMVWDPFGGTGTTGRVALLLNRRVIISELYEKNIPKIEEILQKGITEFNTEEYENIKVEYTENEPLELAA